MLKTFACSAPYNEGGLGKRLATIVEEARTARELGCYYTIAARSNDAHGREISLQRYRLLFRLPPLRYSHRWRDYLASDLFDRAVSSRLERTDVFTGFSGRALHTFRHARKIGVKRLVLEAGTSHVSTMLRQHTSAANTYPLEASWLNRAQYKKMLREYDVADVIIVLSEYARQSFLAAGVPAMKVQRRYQPVARRFAPPPSDIPADGFHIVYVGRLEVSKGVPILLDAFGHLKDADARLTLVGGTATDAMERYLRRAAQADRRIRISSGDPLPHLHRADVLVHPSFEDGLGIAPLEALACGVPVIVTEDTGMKEFVVQGENGYILPTGDVGALVEQLRAIRARPLKGTFEPFTRR